MKPSGNPVYDQCAHMKGIFFGSASERSVRQKFVSVCANQNFFFVFSSVRKSGKLRESRESRESAKEQGDQIGRIFDYWVTLGFGHFLKITNVAQK
jgi:hypothetical protein